jgi:hypothetical protein
MECEVDNLPLLSIVIPTRNRILYAISAIQSILEIPDRRLELVVHDNSDSRELALYVHQTIKDTRFRYQHTLLPLSFVRTFDMAVGMATGQYVCVIGDDDGVNPEIIEGALFARSRNLDCLALKTTANYRWPAAGIPSTVFTKSANGFLSISGFRQSITHSDVETELRTLVRNGGLYYLDFHLPKLYHGLVHRRCLEAVHAKTGTYFVGLSPDISAALAIACVAKRVMVTDYPLTIPGVCSVSGSVVEGSIKQHSKTLEDAPHLRARGEYHWCELVPRVYTPETIWVDSAVAALRSMGRADLVRQLSVPKLAAYCIGSNRGVTWPVLRDLFAAMRTRRDNRASGALRFAWSFLTGLGAKFARRAWNRFLLLLGTRAIHRIDGLVDMVEVSHALTRYLKGTGRSFAGCVGRAAD